MGSSDDEIPQNPTRMFEMDDLREGDSDDSAPKVPEKKRKRARKQTLDDLLRKQGIDTSRKVVAVAGTSDIPQRSKSDDDEDNVETIDEEERKMDAQIKRDMIGLHKKLTKLENSHVVLIESLAATLLSHKTCKNWYKMSIFVDHTRGTKTHRIPIIPYIWNDKADRWNETAKYHNRNMRLIAGVPFAEELYEHRCSAWKVPLKKMNEIQDAELIVKQKRKELKKWEYGDLDQPIGTWNKMVLDVLRMEDAHYMVTYDVKGYLDILIGIPGRLHDRTSIRNLGKKDVLKKLKKHWPVSATSHKINGEAEMAGTLAYLMLNTNHIHYGSTLWDIVNVWRALKEGMVDIEEHFLDVTPPSGLTLEKVVTRHNLKLGPTFSSMDDDMIFSSESEGEEGEGSVCSNESVVSRLCAGVSESVLGHFRGRDGWRVDRCKGKIDELTGAKSTAKSIRQFELTKATSARCYKYGVFDLSDIRDLIVNYEAGALPHLRMSEDDKTELFKLTSLNDMCFSDTMQYARRTACAVGMITFISQSVHACWLHGRESEVVNHEGTWKDSGMYASDMRQCVLRMFTAISERVHMLRYMLRFAKWLLKPTALCKKNAWWIHGSSNCGKSTIFSKPLGELLGAVVYNMTCTKSEFWYSEGVRPSFLFIMDDSPTILVNPAQLEIEKNLASATSFSLNVKHKSAQKSFPAKYLRISNQDWYDTKNIRGDYYASISAVRERFSQIGVMPGLNLDDDTYVRCAWPFVWCVLLECVYKSTNINCYDISDNDIEKVTDELHSLLL